MSDNDEMWMQQALALARQARDADEVPVGAVVVLENQIIGRGFNQPIGRKDPCAHAEIIALRDAARQQNNYRLLNASLYVTLEPCIMCVGAMIHARIKRLVFAAYDKKTGAVCSAFEALQARQHNHTVEWFGGVLADQSSVLLKDFFRQRR